MYHILEYFYDEDEDYYYNDGEDRDYYPEEGEDGGGGVSDQELEEDEDKAGSGKVDERFLIDAFLKASGMRHASFTVW